MSLAVGRLAAPLRNAVIESDQNDVVPTSAVSHVPAFADDVPRTLEAIRR